jgi:thioredoxin-like negative regulator of GroEL
MKIKFLQEGGAAPAPADAQAQAQAGPNPEEQIMQMAQQLVQQLGPEAAAVLAQAIMEMLQGGGGGGAAPQGEPVYAKKGGKLVLVNRK